MTQKTQPTVSRALQDGTLVELLYQADLTTALAVRRPDGSVSVVGSLDLPDGEQLVPYSAKNNLIATGCVLFPSDVGDFGDKGDLVCAVQAFIHRYADLSRAFEEIATYYVLLSWVFDAFEELPYLRIQGDFGTGKTRALLTIGSLTYKPFFASGASTVSPLFHVLDAFRPTLLLDEADFRFSDATADITKILNNGNMNGLPVLRTMTNRHRELNPQAFTVFGPKIVAMRKRFTDDALESRFFTEYTMRRPLRPDIPIHTPPALKVEALALRNRLLAWRFIARDSLAACPDRLVPGVSPRANQVALALLSIVDDPAARDRIAAELLGSEARGAHERASSQLAVMLDAVEEAFDRSHGPSIRISEIVELFSSRRPDQAQNPMSAKWVGWFVRTHLRLTTYKSGGVYVVPQSERAKLAGFRASFGLPEWTGSTATRSGAGLRAREARPPA
jgi:hypothetical protein